MDAILIYYTVEDGVVTPHEVPVYITKKSIARSEFYMSYNTALHPRFTLEVRIEDYELTEHTDEDGKIKYASQVRYRGGNYDVIKDYFNKNKVEITCG